MDRRWGWSLMCVVLAGCSGGGLGGSNEVGCAVPAGEEALRTQLQQAAVSLLRDDRNADGSPLFSSGTIEAAVDSIGVSLSNHRTTRDADKSKRVDCQAQLTFSIPSDRLNQTTQGLQGLIPGALDGLADRAGYRHEANTLSSEVRYALQPTDDGKAIYAELEQAEHHAQVLQQLAAGWLIKPLLDQRGQVGINAADAVANANAAQAVPPQGQLPQAIPMVASEMPVPARAAMSGIPPLPPSEEIAQGSSAGFNCAKASTPIEKAICASPALSQLDGDLTNTYLSISRSNIDSGEREALKASQRQWLRVRDRCQDSLCIRDQYIEQIREVCGFGDHPYCKVYR